MRQISIGNQSFESLIEEKAFYVDKSIFIKEWWDNLDVVTLIMRPRRFGKTLNMQMLECFFSNRYEGRGDLFDGLDIWKYEKFRQMQGTFPVIFLSFANVKETNAADAIYRICSILSQLFREYDFLLKSEKLSRSEKDRIEKYCSSISRIEAEDSIGFLSSVLEKHFGKKVIILLDEYDTPLQEACVDGYWDEMSAFIRALFNSTFKTNSSMQRSLMTGITRVSKESIFSDLNNLTVADVTSEQYETSFGFTQNEVLDSLDEYGLAEEASQVKKWYDGFTIGDTTDIYNPWSITNYLKYRQFKAYWANTSGNSLISYELRTSNTDSKDEMQALLEGRTVRAKINDQVVYSQLDGDSDALWSFFLASGYMTVVSRELSGSELYCELKLTNQEVRFMFRSMINSWFNESGSDFGQFMRSLIAGDDYSANKYLNGVLFNMVSFFDTKRQVSDERRPESFYHGLVLGIVVQESGYHIESNGESGYGRYDIMMIPTMQSVAENNGLPVIIMEFKIMNPVTENSLDDTASRALAQIEEKKYEAKALDMGFSDKNILKYGLGFSGKKVVVKKG